ncbi:ABC transporter permease [Brevibacterium luteolum]|uniref:ABC transporter permease n=1 Tax=Brevibacterium luteolum TaxID=199591 RepID=UPI00223BACAC|nr:ABC transporter permease [Brevibacterium luteolum]MCT1829761.1 ABC transporter permease [Brevibacterium luteolum]
MSLAGVKSVGPDADGFESKRRYGVGSVIATSWRAFGSLLVLLVVWEAVGRASDVVWLPPVSKVVIQLVELFATGELSTHLFASLSSLAIGFSLSLIIGLVVGVLMGLFPSVYTALDVYVNAMLFAPSLIFAPIFFAIFGLSDATRISVVVMYTVFVIIINTATAVRDVEAPLLEMSAVFGANRWKTLRKIVIPASYPLVIAGLRLGAGRAVKGMINGEIFIALVGIGGLAAKYGKAYDFVSLWAISLFIMILAVVINLVVSWLEKRLTSWVE